MTDMAATPVLDPEQAAKLLDLLGLPANTVDPELILATVADLANQGAGETKPSEVAAAAKRAGLEVLDNDTAEALRRDAAEGRQIKAAAKRKHVEDTVSEAIGKGKITLSRRKHWVDLISADPGMADVLAGVPDETAVALTEIGHGVSNDEQNSTADEWFH